VGDLIAVTQADPPPRAVPAPAAAAVSAGEPEPGLAAASPARTTPAETAPAEAIPAEAASAGTGPAEAAPDESPRRRSLSPSRAGDFLTCPLLYRFRVVDRLPEPPSPAAARGTLVHAVLERLFDHPAAARTPQAARSLLGPEWARLTAEEPELTGLFEADEQRDVWLDGAATMLDRYFTLEDPRRLEPAHRELHVEAVLESGLLLRGYIDRLDVAPGGEIRIVDYKTGTAPREEYEARALFQMKFYALVLWRSQAQLPRLLQLIYLGSGEIVRYAPDEADLIATERKINALWRAIERARDAGDWRPRPGRLCDWCAHKPICPAFGGTPPPLPDPAAESQSAADVSDTLPAADASATAHELPVAAAVPAQPAAIPDALDAPASPAGPDSPAPPGPC
jgi:putative RecB family exonuclease